MRTDNGCNRDAALAVGPGLATTGPRSNPVSRRDCRQSRRGLALAVAALLAMAAPMRASAALCGDTTGNGFLTVSDALATLRLAVTGGYDRRGDVAPAGGNGGLTVSDALETLRAVLSPRTPLCKGVAATRAVVTTEAYDFSSAGLAVVDVATRTFHFRGGSLEGDSVIRVPRGIPVVVNRKGHDTLQTLDVSKPALPNVKECSVADGFDSNPQDVLLLSDTKGYVTPYAGASLQVISPPVLLNPAVDPACDGLVTGHIDLSSFDSDGVPQMDQMLVVGDTLFVSLQRLDASLQPKTTNGNGVLVAIDTKTDTVKGSVALSFANPFAETKGLVWDEFQKRIFVSGPGRIADPLHTGTTRNDGGIEAIDPATMKSTGMLLTGADIHSDIFDIVIVGTERAFAIVADDVSNSVVDIDLKTRSIRKVLLSSTALITDIEMTEGGELWVAYRGETGADPAGLRIFRASDDAEITTKPIALGQAPFTLAFLP